MFQSALRQLTTLWFGFEFWTHPGNWGATGAAAAEGLGKLLGELLPNDPLACLTAIVEAAKVGRMLKLD